MIRKCLIKFHKIVRQLPDALFNVVVSSLLASEPLSSSADGDLEVSLGLI